MQSWVEWCQEAHLPWGSASRPTWPGCATNPASEAAAEYAQSLNS